jgi:transposase
MEIQRRTRSNEVAIYSEAFKRHVINEYLATGLPKETIQKKYGIKFNNAILYWMRRLGYVDRPQKVVILHTSNQLELAKKYTPEHDPSKDTRSLEKRIKELEKQLEDEKIRSEMLTRMIDIAETELKVPIRKKPNTK